MTQSHSILPAAAQPWRRRVVQTALVLTLGGTTMFGGPVLAQDGSGGATPEPTVAPTCTVPDLSAAGPQVQPPVSGSATPAASASPATLASPAASPVATPPAAATPATEDSTTLQNELTLSATAVADCLSKGDFTTLASITGDTYRGQLIGTDLPVTAEDFADLAPTLVVIPYTILDLTDARLSGNTATALVTYQIGHQVRSGTWTFSSGTVGGKKAWVLESEAAQAVTKPETAEASTVSIEKNAYTITPDTIDGGEVFFTITNKDKVDHELFVVRLVDGTKVDVLLTTPGPGLPKGVNFIGQVTVPAGSDSELLLTDLAPGTYTVVDLLPNDQGLPHLSDGMSATFTVE